MTHQLPPLPTAKPWHGVEAPWRKNPQPMAHRKAKKAQREAEMAEIQRRHARS